MYFNAGPVHLSHHSVFLQYQMSEFRQKESEEKMIDILQKSWRKMGPKVTQTHTSEILNSVCLLFIVSSTYFHRAMLPLLVWFLALDLKNKPWSLRRFLEPFTSSGLYLVLESWI